LKRFSLEKFQYDTVFQFMVGSTGCFNATMTGQWIFYQKVSVFPANVARDITNRSDRINRRVGYLCKQLFEIAA
jgi:hypothetical protein